MSERREKFTPGPWRVRDKTYGKYRFLTVVNDASPMVIIANMPSLHDIPLREWKNAYDIDEVAANAALIAQSPSLYANEETSCYVMSQALDFIQRRLTKQDNLLIIEMLKRQIKTTEKLLAKCRGEEQ